MAEVNRIKVVIVDDHPIFRHGLRQVIDADPRLCVVAEAGDGETALRLIKEHEPDVAVLDVDLPQISGLDLARTLQTLRRRVHVMLLTMYKEENMVNAAMDRGVRGYVLKDNAMTDIVAGIKAVAAGESYLSPSISGYLLRRRESADKLRQTVPALETLTAMERRVLKFIAENKTSKEIAAELFISHRTVETHRANICSKLNLRGSHRLLQFALEHRSSL
jgi:DNA-binding NarL/FixJ family response regulator